VLISQMEELSDSKNEVDDPPRSGSRPGIGSASRRSRCSSNSCTASGGGHRRNGEGLATQREMRESERAEKDPSATIMVHGMPDAGITEERLEAIAWEAAVQAGSSMPNGVHFAYDRITRKFRGFALIEFPHKEAAKLFKKETKGMLSVEGYNLALRYHHAGTERSRSRSRGGDAGGDRRGPDEPSVTLIIKGLSPSTLEAALISVFQPYATIKDIRHFPRRGFAFLQFHSIEDAASARFRFERDCRCMVDGYKVLVDYAKEREDGRYTMAERGLIAKQAMATAEATAELEKIAQQQVQEENTSKALSGVNAQMWANYMQSCSQTETVQSANSFTYDKDSGYYLDSKAGLYYDPNTTYFFTTDYRKYFLYDHDEKLLCLVDAQGQKVPHGERRPLPSAQAEQESGRNRPPRPPDKPQRPERPERPLARPQQQQRPRSRSKLARNRSRCRSRDRSRDRRRDRRRDRSRDRSRGRSRDRDRRDRGDRGGEARGGEVRGGGCRERRREPESHSSPQRLDMHKPIHFPGGDPLAKLMPAEPAEKPEPKKKTRTKPVCEGVLGLASMPDNRAEIATPGKVTVLAVPKPAPVTTVSSLGSSSPQLQAGTPVGFVPPGPVTGAAGAVAGAETAPGPVAPGPVAAADAGAAAAGEAICEVCMRRFGSEDALRRHEQFSDLHKQNLARIIEAAI